MTQGKTARRKKNKRKRGREKNWRLVNHHATTANFDHYIKLEFVYKKENPLAS